MSLYSDDVHQYMRDRDWPKGLVYEVREHDDPAPHLNIIFFRDNWLTLDFEAQQKTTAIVAEIMTKLWADGIPTYVGKIERG